MEEPAAATKTEVNTEEDANRFGKPILLGKGKKKKKKADVIDKYYRNIDFFFLKTNSKTTVFQAIGTA